MIRYWYMFLADSLLTAAVIFFAMMIRLEIFYPEYFLFSIHLRTIWPFIILAMVIRPVVFYFSGIYQRMWRYATTRDFFRLVVAVGIGSLILSLVTLLLFRPFLITNFPRSLLILEGLLSIFFLGGLRVILKVSENYADEIDWKKVDIKPARRALIVGAGDTGVHLAREFMDNPQLGTQPVAFVDDDQKKIGRKTHRLDVFGPLVTLADIVQKMNADEVIIAIPNAPAQTIQNIKNICHTISIPFSIASAPASLLSQEDVAAGNVSSLRLPMSLPDITTKEIQNVIRVMQSRNLSIGSQTVMLEDLIAAECNMNHAVAVVNGTAALHMCVVAAGIQAGDEVITTPFSFVSSANCILYERATPVFVDIEPITLGIAPDRIEAAITERTKAIVVVHVFGQPSDMDPIMEIAARHNLLVIEDACEAIGAEYKGRKAGAIGKAGTFAFYPNKQITTGEGAMIVTNDEEWTHLFRSLRNQGRDKFDGWLNHSRLGYNYRMSELNAAVGVVQIKRLNELLNKRAAVADEYNRIVSGIEGVTPLTIAPTTTRMSWFVYVVRFTPDIDRDMMVNLLAGKGVPSRPYFFPIHLQPFYRKMFGFKPGDFPESEAAGASILALPFHANMKKEEIEVVCKAIADTIPEAIKKEGNI